MRLSILWRIMEIKEGVIRIKPSEISIILHMIRKPNSITVLFFIQNKNHFVNFTGATFVLATHVEGSFSSTSLSGDMKIFFIANILKRWKQGVMNNVKRQNVRESRILNSWEFAHLANVNIAWQRLFENILFCCFISQSSDRLPPNEF